jgi:2-iminobutanoate/2-iminopropanoate deaminase
MNNSNQAAFNLPYSPVKQAGSLYFIAGHTGVDVSTMSASADVVQQTHKLFENLQHSMQEFDLSLEDIVKTTIFLTDMGDFQKVNEAYATYFQDSKPARSTVAVKELPRVAGDTPLKIEIEAVAYKP